MLALIVFIPNNHYILVMTIEQKKISLINWIISVEDELILDQMAEFRKPSLNELPSAIVQLLDMAEAEPSENLVKHTSVRDILKTK